MWSKFVRWCGCDSASSRLTRTIFQAVIGVIINFVPDLISGSVVIPYEYKPFVQALVMAILAPIQSAIGSKNIEKIEEDFVIKE